MLDPSGHKRTPRITGSLGRASTLAVVTAALVAGAGLPTVVTAQAASVTPKRVGVAPATPAGAAKAAAPGGDTQLDLSVTLEPHNPGELENFISSVTTPGSPYYRHYLGTGEFGKRFGADPATVANVRQALQAAGLTPGEIGANGLTIPVTATVDQAKKAFSTDFVGYRLADGSTGYANTQAPAVRGDVAGAIAGVVGLDTTAKLKPRSVKQKNLPALTSTATGGLTAHNINTSPALCSGWQNLLSSHGLSDGTDYYSSGALATAYDVNGLPDGAAGSTVAIMSLENYDSAAIAAYQSCNGTKSVVTNVRVGGTDGPLAQNEGGETALDIETVAAMAPGAAILVYQGANTDQGVLDNYQRIVNDNRAQVVSVSWGLCEAAGPADTALNTILKQAAAQGQTVVAASGDSGSTDCYRPGGSSDTRLTVDSPAVLPYVTGVGGTSMSGLGQFPGPVSAWNDSTGSGGGGVSALWKVKSTDFPWSAVRAASYSDACLAGAGESCRQVPDVSALAAGEHGYLVFTNVTNGNVSAGIFGGTSGAAPLWAALIADANASIGCAANGPVGYLNPALYKLAGDTSVFTDVTAGNNNLTASGLTDASKYPAAAGYDLATGLGAPKGRGLIAALCSALPTQPAGTFKSVSPTRLLDTRHTGVNNAQNIPVPARSSMSLKVAGNADNIVPATGVTSVVLNITATDTNGGGFLTAWPTGSTMPTASNLNWMQGSIAVPNLVTVPVGTDGKVSLFNGGWNGSVALVVDLFGYYTTDTPEATFNPVVPTRVFDTRYGQNAPQAQIGSKKQLDVKVAGGLDAHGNSLPVPANATAVVLNTTVVKGTSNGWMTVFPTGTAQPKSSNLNWDTNQVAPNLVIVPVGAGGSVSFFNGSWGSVDVLADVFGYFTADSTGGKFHVAGPKRLVDTRTGKGAPAPAKLSAGQVLHVTLNDNGALSGATSVVLNITVTNTAGGGYLNAWPGNTTRPVSSNLNWYGGQTVANMVVVPVHDGSVDIASNSSTDVLVDLAGYYSN